MRQKGGIHMFQNKESSGCKICGNNVNNTFFHVQERQLNRGGEFLYLYCERCGTLQLDEKVSNIGDYYPKDYYSFHLKETRKILLPKNIKKKCVTAISNCSYKIPFTVESILRDSHISLGFLIATNVKLKSAILDVGGGNGKWLNALSHWGFQNLTCIDLYCENAFSGVKFIQCDIRDLDDMTKYDLITFHHSFEHMEEPESVLDKVNKLLNPSGVCIIRIPVCECEAWNIYHENWYQIDAPRHTFLYTERSMRMLCERVGLTISRVIYDSKPGQFFISEEYKNTDLNLKEIDKKTKLKRMIFRKRTWDANKSGKGDSAAFYITHK